jgi:hypothetical protein
MQDTIRRHEKTSWTLQGLWCQHFDPLRVHNKQMAPPAI